MVLTKIFLGKLNFVKYLLLIKFLYCFLNAHYIAVYKNVSVYMWFAWIYSLFIIAFSTILWASLLALICKVTIKESKFINLMIGLYVISIIVSSIQGCIFILLNYVGINIKEIYRDIIFVFVECYLYHTSLKVSYAKYNIKTKLIGIIIISINMLAN